jgi:hypothetical protein
MSEKRCETCDYFDGPFPFHKQLGECTFRFPPALDVQENEVVRLDHYCDLWKLKKGVEERQCLTK